jgi:hypothetical protein
MNKTYNAVNDAVKKLVEDGGYTLENDVISDLGKFEGEHVMTLYFYDAHMNGDGEQYEGNDLAFEVSDEEAEAFEIAKGAQVILCFSEQGFVSSYVNDVPVEPEPEPCAEDYAISDSGTLGSLYSVGIVEGKFLGEYKTLEEAEAAIRADMEGSNYFPNVWMISDHGNAHLISI